jgi:uncharacterized protein (DUF1697 family)
VNRFRSGKHHLLKRTQKAATLKNTLCQTGEIVNTYIALFRGINVGGKNILPMRELVALLETLGCENIQIYIQSGNVVFRRKKETGEKIADEISKAVLEKKGFEPGVFLLGVEQLLDAVRNNPFETSNGKALHFFFLESQPGRPDIDQLMSLKAKTEEFKLGNKILYLYAPDGVGRSKLAAAVEKAMGVPVTARNWNTVSKLASMFETA